MLSGNGRHRRPRQAPALIVAAGVTGSAIAIPLLGATSASAADGTTWDRVAECESGGTWSANDGNGYYGGLQLTQENWESYGGLAYAPSADQASRSQQIAVAEKVLDGKGLAAWPTCGPLSGLSKDSGSVDVDTGLADDSSSSSDSSSASPSESPSPDSSSSDASSDAAGNSTKSDAPSDASDSSGDASTDAGADAGTTNDDDSDKSGQSADSSGASGATGSGSTGSGRHRGDSADDSAASGSSAGGDEDAAGRHASRDSGAARDAADGSYTIRPGDSLSTIADSLDLDGGWRELYTENKESVGADPDLILPGQSLELGSTK